MMPASFEWPKTIDENSWLDGGISYETGQFLQFNVSHPGYNTASLINDFLHVLAKIKSSNGIQMVL